MLLPGHIAAGYIVGKALLAAGGFELSGHDKNIVLGTILAASIAPDLDLIYYFVKNKSAKLANDRSHHDLVPHAPLPWLLAGLIVYILGGSDLSKALGLAIWVGSWTHFVLDSIEYGIMWLWPFSKKRFCIHKTQIQAPVIESTTKFYAEAFRKVYMKNWTFWIELMIIAAAVYLYLR